MKDNIGQYQIIRILGRGGMGAVYLAKDSLLEREVAIKTVQSHMDTSSDRFFQEARTLARLNHPNIGSLYNLVQEGDEVFMIMEYIKGIGLDDLIKAKEKISVQQSKTIFSQILRGLKHAHKQGIIHRDIKSSNVMINETGTAKLMDFGIAVSSGNERYTRTGNILGTLEYIAPEIIKGEQPSEQSDIYAMGILLYEMVSGKTPFQGTNEYALINAHMEKKPPELGAEVPSSLKKLIKKCLAKTREKRYHHVDEILRDLSLVQEEETKKPFLHNPTGKLPKMEVKDFTSRYGAKAIMAISAIVIIVCMALLIPKGEKGSEQQSEKPEVQLSDSRSSGNPAAPVTIASKDPKELKIGQLIYEGQKYSESKTYLIGRRNLWEVCQDILEIDSHNREAKSWIDEMINFFMREGSKAMKNDQFSAAKSFFENVLVIDPDHQQARNELFKITQRQEALNQMKPARKSIPKNVVKPLAENKKESKPKTEIEPIQEDEVLIDNTAPTSKDTKKSVVPKEVVNKGTPKKENRGRKISVNIPKNEDILVAVVETLSSRDNRQKGQVINLIVLKDVTINGVVAIPQGSRARGTLENFKTSNDNQKGLIELKVKQVQAIDGTWLEVKRGNFKIPGDKGEEIKFTPSTKLQVKTSNSTNITAYQ